jgi:hypothetical protein
MATSNTPLEFTGEQSEAVRRLALMMKGVAAVLLGLAGLHCIDGLVTVLAVSPTGLFAIIEGLITGLLGLIMMSAAADVRFMAETKFTSVHLGNGFQNLSMFYKVQFLLALFLAAIALARLVLG